jgi:hypothetical protein
MLLHPCSCIFGPVASDLPSCCNEARNIAAASNTCQHSPNVLLLAALPLLLCAAADQLEC